MLWHVIQHGHMSMRLRRLIRLFISDQLHNRRIVFRKFIRNTDDNFIQNQDNQILTATHLPFESTE